MESLSVSCGDQRIPLHLDLTVTEAEPVIQNQLTLCDVQGSCATAEGKLSVVFSTQPTVWHLTAKAPETPATPVT